METVNVHAAKTHFSRLLDRAQAGQEFVIAKAGRPVARLGPLVRTGQEAPAGPARRQIQGPRQLQRTAAGRDDRRLRRSAALRVLVDTHPLPGQWRVRGGYRKGRGPSSSIRRTRCSTAPPAYGKSPSRARCAGFQGQPDRARARSRPKRVLRVAGDGGACGARGRVAGHSPRSVRSATGGAVACRAMTLLTNDAVLVGYGPFVQLV